jgi:hypothetical protein
VSYLLHGQEFIASGTFTVPDGVSSVFVTMVGGGGGGCGHASADPGNGHGGGGSGELAWMVPYKVTPGEVIAVTIGANGLGGIAETGTNGGRTSFGTLSVEGGKATVLYSTRQGGAGGGFLGVQTPSSQNGVIGVYEGGRIVAGGGGGGGGTTVSTVLGTGAPSINFPGGPKGLPGTGSISGGGGASSPWGIGGSGGKQNSGGGPLTTGVAAAASAYGAGGGGGGASQVGGTTANGGDGAPGYCFVQWIN